MFSTRMVNIIVPEMNESKSNQYNAFRCTSFMFYAIVSIALT